ncbi:serpin family protein [Chondromyces crocatus]|uniref:Proteinase IV n=1 Tax=Chondromyces crocatus TaxID=52 RepID=A0A0K1EMY9_CHOCO|nr:serpin family protein [Chondromyces crocatus]AKT42191.1 proteinase IV [Chondromyces crocatus]
MRFLHLLPLTLSLTALACTSTGVRDPNTDPDLPGDDIACNDPGIAGCVVVGEASRNLSPQIPATDRDALAQGNTEFALALYQQLREDPGNLFYSPYSISSALAMTWAGARGQTEQDMASTLRFTLPQDRLHPAFNALDLALTSRGQGAQGADGQPFRLTVANAVWAQINYSFEAPFLNVLGESYGAGVHVVDFVNKTLEAVDLINGWVEKKTEDRIKDLLSSPPVTPNTRMVLTNAVYFNASWLAQFEEDDTQPGSFTTQAGQSVQVPMMNGTFETTYSEGPGFKAASLPYDGQELDMVLVLPDDLGTFEQGLDAVRLDQVFSGLGPRLVETRMPKFEFASKFSLKDVLSKMGMGIAFSAEADLSGISTQEHLSITDVIHQSFVNVSETGTEAAAATAVIIGRDSAPSDMVQFHLDRPFLFFIRDIATHTVVFAGRVSDPAGN